MMKYVDNMQDNFTIMHGTLHKNHNQYTHLVSVIARIILGMLIYNNYLSSTWITIIAFSTVIVFGTKFILNEYKNINTWKVYLRTSVIYLLVMITNLTNTSDNANHLSGTLILLDGLMGLQSRHITNTIYSTLDTFNEQSKFVRL